MEAPSSQLEVGKGKWGCHQSRHIDGAKCAIHMAKGQGPFGSIEGLAGIRRRWWGWSWGFIWPWWQLSTWWVYVPIDNVVGSGSTHPFLQEQSPRSCLIPTPSKDFNHQLKVATTTTTTSIPHSCSINPPQFYI